MDTVSFGENLIEYRKSHYLTQKQMAKLLGLSTNHIGVLERGIKQPRTSTITAFMKLKEKQARTFGEGKPMTETEIIELNHLWRMMSDMSPELRREILHVMKHIAKWF